MLPSFLNDGAFKALRDTVLLEASAVGVLAIAGAGGRAFQEEEAAHNYSVLEVEGGVYF